MMKVMGYFHVLAPRFRFMSTKRLKEETGSASSMIKSTISRELFAIR